MPFWYVCLELKTTSATARRPPWHKRTLLENKTNKLLREGNFILFLLSLTFSSCHYFFLSVSVASLYILRLELYYEQVRSS